jgi:hypothetical protein
MMCDNYRADPLLCTTYKLLANILYVKLVPYAEEIMENFYYETNIGIILGTKCRYTLSIY